VNRLFLYGCAAFALAGTTPANADEVQEFGGVKLVTKTLPIELPQVHAGELGGQTIFLNRCVGGCTVHVGSDDATTDTSVIARSTAMLAEYNFPPGEWEATVQCVREIYSPYDVTIVDERPTSGTYEQIMVAGRPQDLGLPSGVGGVGSMALGCAPIPNGMAFAFTSAIPVFAAEAGGSRVHGLCWIIAQETAHNFGLDHQYSFADNNASACNDPMTYRFDCGGQKFFRNRLANVGATALCNNSDISNACRCGTTQNSHQKLISMFGAGQSIVAAPTSTVTTPQEGGVLGTIIGATSGSQRGVAKVEFFLNGWRWGTTQGVAFGPMGQPNPGTYSFALPTNVPDGVYDVMVKAYDDLGTATESTVVHATKGAPCASADTCLEGQKCEEGKCFWDPPTLELGDGCDYDQACKSELCAGTADTKVCTTACTPGAEQACPEESGLTCQETSNGMGVCFLPESDSCCSTSNQPGGVASRLALSLGVFGLIVIRRRRTHA
jgi:hypothetical protein